jgi:hypothetical protein
LKVQQWGTFSVRDHIRPRAFVADVLLYDKLVIPRPPTDKELYAEGQTGSAGDQMNRWRKNQWEPDRQRELLDILGEYELAIELPWAGKAQYDWNEVAHKADPDSWECGRSELAQSIQFQIEEAKKQSSDQFAYIATAGVLSLYVANQMQNDVARKLFNRSRTADVPVESVIAYGSYSDFERDQDAGDGSPVPASESYGMFGWEFFVPEDSDKTDTELLRLAAKLASSSDFCETRQEFQGWLRQMYGGEVDRHDAYEKMMTKYAEYKKIMTRSGFTTAARYAAKVAQVLAPLAGLGGHALGLGVGVAAAGAAWGVEQWVPLPTVPKHLRSAAMLYDARKFFGKR